MPSSKKNPQAIDGHEAVTLTRPILTKLYETLLRCTALAELTKNRGREAMVTAAVTQLRGEEVLLTTGKDRLSAMVRGVPARKIVTKDEETFAAAADSKRIVLDPESLGVAAGVARALRMEGEGRAALSILNGEDEAALFPMLVSGRLPLVMLLPVGTRTDGMIQAARRCNLPVITVDGNDVLAVFRVVQESLLRARSGDGPALIECIRVRGAGSRDPVALLEHELQHRKVWSPQWKKKTLQVLAKELAKERR